MSSKNANRAYEEKQKANGKQFLTTRLNAQTTRDLAFLVQRHGATKEAVAAAIQMTAAFYRAHGDTKWTVTDGP